MVVTFLKPSNVLLLACCPVIYVNHLPRQQAGFMIDLAPDAKGEVEQEAFSPGGRLLLLRRSGTKEESDPLLAHEVVPVNLGVGYGIMCPSLCMMAVLCILFNAHYDGWK